MAAKTGAFLVVVVALLVPSLAVGQTIDTNRPGFSFSPNVVGPGQWQLETGIMHIQIDKDTSATFVPMAEVRFGVADQLEVFVSSLSWLKTKSSSDETSGLVDMALGAKVNVSDAEAKTQMALLFQLSVPTGEHEVSSNRWDPSIAFIWTHSGDLAIAGTVKISQFESGFQLDNGLKLPFSWSDSHSGFVEWEASLQENGGSIHWLNGGYQWLINDRTQIDFNVGLGLNAQADDYRLGGGFSIQL